MAVGYPLSVSDFKTGLSSHFHPALWLPSFLKVVRSTIVIIISLITLTEIDLSVSLVQMLLCFR